MAETSYGNSYLEGVKSTIFSALAHFSTVRNYYFMQVRNRTVRETRYRVVTKACLFFFFLT